MISNTQPQNLASHFAPIVAEYRSANFLEGAMLAALTLHAEGALSVVWAPFDNVPASARLVVVGITPGATQAEKALDAFRTALRNGNDPAAASRIAKLKGSFSGAMRTNLIDMLDHIGAQRMLGVASCSAVFEPARELVHFTSALRYPVFIGGANYNGAPDMLKTPYLLRMVDTSLAEEARRLPNALWLPLGPKAGVAVQYLARSGLLDARRVLAGLPHPSGANAERIAYFLQRKAASALSAKTSPGPLDAAREALRTQLVQLTH
ncbi:hypothetical protein [Roseomonas sp. CECT 9278]|uniref:hypothetical protein n=1 Tax=Roseomonas sp. CECT 9278 TaxID=2845823 RepID=UPI001E3D2AA5|nr:hypothetical protein [Roseomonas sp. CECT 9278]CAH0266522.1 hypothetical protein ROS9278_03539 [Roseomonas sp. CECT 9278]